MFAAKIQNSFGTYKFHPKRSADFVDSNIIRIFAEKFELWQERPNKSL